MTSVKLKHKRSNLTPLSLSIQVKGSGGSPNLTDITITPTSTTMYYKPNIYGVDGFNNVTVNNTQSGITTLTINTYTLITASSSTKLTGYNYNNNSVSITSGTFYSFNISGLVNMS